MKCLATLSILMMALALPACTQAPARATNAPKASSVKAQRYETVADAQRNAAPDDVICVQEKRVGTHIREVSCLTPQQRREQRRQSQEAVRELTRRGTPHGETQ